MLGFAAPRRFCREHRAPCWFLGKMLRSAGSRFRSTGAPKMPGNSSNQGHYTPPAVVKCKFPLSELRGEATYYTHRAVAGSRFPSTMPLHFKESFEYRFLFTFHVATRQIFAVFHDKTGVVVLYRDSTRSALWKFAEFAIS